MKQQMIEWQQHQLDQDHMLLNKTEEIKQQLAEVSQSSNTAFG